MGNPPTGTVTFLFTDIEGSTRLAQQYPDAISGLLERHHAILRSAIEGHGGYVFEIVGDAFCTAFQTVREALDAALEAQCRMAGENWSPEAIRVRMGISTGTAQVKLPGDQPPDYSGYLSLARVQRVMSVAYGGQILLANASAELVRGELPTNVSLRDLGEHRLKSLLNPEHLWQATAPGLQVEFPPLRSLNAIPNNLPLQLTSFIGREREMAEVAQLLEAHRLVTLTGSGGTGKSRLSLQVAAEVLDQFRHGIWFVELAPISDPVLIAQSVVRLLGLNVEPGREPAEILKDYLADKTLLLILDNCEHLLDAACRFADAILRAAPAVKIMPTSREALNVVGEQAYRVPSLSAPDMNHLPPVDQLTQFEAVRLFIERAALASPKFSVNNDNAPAVAQICHRLDGIPLAIELAAARVKSLPLDAIVSRLDDRFRLLTGGSRAALPRQQTLRALIDWSYNLLSEPERSVLQRLSVFRGGWTLEAAEAVCAGEGIDTLESDDLLAKLVDKSLVSLDEHGRYRMLETIRQYAEEKLADSGGAETGRDHHLQYLLELAEKAESYLLGPNQLEWLNRLEAELDNLRAAILWAQDRDAESFLRLTSALWRFWPIRVGTYEHSEWMAHALASTRDWKSIHRARALAHAAGQYDDETRNEQLARDAFALGEELGNKQSMAWALMQLGYSHPFQKSEEAVDTLIRALNLSQEIGDHWLSANALQMLGLQLNNHNDFDSASAFFEQALQESRLAGDQRLLSSALRGLAYLCLTHGRAKRAEDLLQEAYAIGEQMGDKRTIMNCDLQLAEVALFREDYGRAEQRLEEAYRAAIAFNYQSDVVFALEYLGILDWALGNTTRFFERAQAAWALAQEINWSVQYASYLLAEAYRIRNAGDLAREHYRKALVLGREASNTEVYCYCFQGLGAIALSGADARRAVRLFSARAKLRPSVRAEDYYPFMVREREKQLAEARARLGNEAFNKAWAEGQAMSEEEMVAYALEEPTSPEN